MRRSIGRLKSEQLPRIMDGTNDAVLQAVGASLQSLVGRNKSVKICISESEGEGVGKGLMMNDSMQVLTILTDRIQHPAGHVIHSAALSHHGNFGCGVTSLVCLAALWSREISDLQKQGIPLPVIFSVFEDCLNESETVTASLQLPLSQIRRQYESVVAGASDSAAAKKRAVLRYSRTFTPSRKRSCEDENLSKGFLEDISKRLCHGRESAMELAVEALLPQLKKSGTTCTSQLDTSKVLSLPVVGVASENSRVVEGVACRLRHDMVHVVQANTDTTLRTVVLCGDASEGYAHRGLREDVKIGTVIRSCDLRVESCDLWLQTWEDVLTQYSIGLLVVQGSVSLPLYDACLSRGTIILSQVSATHITALCDVSGARPISYITQIRDESAVGMVIVSVMEGGWRRQTVRHASQRETVGQESVDHYCCVRPTMSKTHCDVTTAILCGHTHSQTSILHHSLTNCLNRLQCVMSDGCVVRGGGWVEARVAATLRSKGQNSVSLISGSIPYRMQTSWLGDYMQSSNTECAVIVSGFAAGLEQFAAVVHRSCDPGLGHFQALSQVKSCGAGTASVQHSGRTSGVGVASRGGALEMGVAGGVAWEVLDASSCKMASWRAAFRLVRTLASVVAIENSHDNFDKTGHVLETWSSEHQFVN